MVNKSTEKPKMYVVRKYIKAVDLKQAIRLEPKTPVHDCYINEDWKAEHLPDAIGFQHLPDEEEDEE